MNVLEAALFLCFQKKRMQNIGENDNKIVFFQRKFFLLNRHGTHAFCNKIDFRILVHMCRKGIKVGKALAARGKNTVTLNTKYTSLVIHKIIPRQICSFLDKFNNKMDGSPHGKKQKQPI